MLKKVSALHPHLYNLVFYEIFPRPVATQPGEVPLPHICGSIGLAWTHDRQYPNQRTGSVEGSLEENCDFIRDWGAAAVLSLTESGVEPATLPLERFARGIRDRHMRFHHLPIPYWQLPTSDFEQRWQEVGPQLRNLVRQGNRIVVHAEGHVARSAMIIARLLVELGYNPREAVEELKSFGSNVFPEDYGDRIIGHVYAQKPFIEDSQIGNGLTAKDRAVGAFLGLAIGDAMGATLQQEARDRCPVLTHRCPVLTHMVGGGLFRLRPGEWTGNTAMALALADTLREHDQFDDWLQRDALVARAKDQYTFNSRGNSLARGRRTHLIHQTVNGFDEDNAHRLRTGRLLEQLTRWMTRGEFSSSGRCVGISEPMRQAILAWQCSGNPLAKPAGPTTGGSSSLVRVAPSAIRYREDRRRLRSYASRQSYTTFGSRDAADACVAFADLVASAIGGTPIGELLATGGYDKRNTGTWPGEIHKRWTGRVAAVLDGSWHRTSRDAIRSDGDVARTLEAALWCIARSHSFEETVLTAAGLGEDAAAITAIAGQLAGAIYGASGIPQAWLNTLVWHDRIVGYADALFPTEIHSTT